MYGAPGLIELSDHWEDVLLEEKSDKSFVVRDAGPKLKEVHNVLPNEPITVVTMVKLNDTRHDSTADLDATLLVDLKKIRSD